jgi:hypothetical protein
MKNFLELLATDLNLTVTVNQRSYHAGLCDILEFDVNDTVTIDDIEILPKYSYLSNHGILKITQPFYQWLHHATAQGWLLKPTQ